MADFETRSSPPEPGRLSKLRTSAVAIMNRHRWATGLAVPFVVVLAVGCTVYWLQLTPEASEPWPPEYRLGLDPEQEGHCYDRDVGVASFSHSNETGYYCVITDATDEKSLIYISRKVYSGSNNAWVEFYYSPSNYFAEGCIADGDTVLIAYSPDNCI